MSTEPAATSHKRGFYPTFPWSPDEHLHYDGTDEVVVRSEFYEAWNYAIWRLDSKSWGQILKGGGGGCRMRKWNTAIAARSVLFVIALFLVTVGIFAGQRGTGEPPPVPGVQKRTHRFTETNEKIEYDVFVSNKVDKSKRKKSPLVIALHGANEQPMGLMRSLTELADKGGYIVAAPMGYTLDGGYGVPALRAQNPAAEKAAELSEKDVMEVLDLMRTEFNVDDRRIYLLGQSMGGGGAIHLGVKYSIWAALGLSAPAMATQQPAMLEAIKDMPVILVHGDADTTVAVERIMPWVDKMRELKMTYEYFEMKGVGHHDAIENGASRIFAFFDKHSKPKSDN